jgi:hypothetical protein
MATRSDTIKLRRRGAWRLHAECFRAFLVDVAERFLGKGKVPICLVKIDCRADDQNPAMSGRTNIEWQPGQVRRLRSPDCRNELSHGDWPRMGEG